MEKYYFDYNILKNIKTKKLIDIKNRNLKLLKLKSPTEMLDVIVEILRRKNYDIFYHLEKVSIRNRKNVYYIKVVIPQMCDITDPGLLRLPNKRMLIEIKEEMNNAC